MLGNVDEEDMSFLGDDNALDYVKRMQKPLSGKSKLRQLFPNTDPELFKILKGLLEFNPHLRLTAKQALQSRLFDDMRSPEYERPSSIKIK